MDDWVMVVVEDLHWRESIASDLAAQGFMALAASTDQGDVLASLVEEELALPSVLVWSSSAATEEDLERLRELHDRGVGVILTADHRTVRELRRADRGGLMSRAWRYGAAAVVARDDADGLTRVARELLRSPAPRASAPVATASHPAA